MKAKMGLLILVVGFCFLAGLTGCDNSGENASRPMTSAESTPNVAAEPLESDGISTESVAQCNQAAMTALQAVLTNDRTLVVNNGQGTSECLLEDYLAQWPSPYMTIDRWAFCDFDQDGTPEIVCNQRMGDNPFVVRLILHYQDGTVYGYARTYRGLGSPKTDGTFDVDDGVLNYGVATISFDHENCMIHDITHCTVEYNQNEPHFVVNNVEGTKAEFDAAMEKQFTKPDVEWFDYTKDEISHIFSAG